MPVLVLIYARFRHHKSEFPSRNCMQKSAFAVWGSEMMRENTSLPSVRTMLLLLLNAMVHNCHFMALHAPPRGFQTVRLHSVWTLSETRRATRTPC